MMSGRIAILVAFITLGLCTVSGAGAAAAQEPEGGDAKRATPASKSKKLDRSGRKQLGKASFYARKFAGRKMADVTPMNPRGPK